MSKEQFVPGDTVAWSSDGFNKSYWDKLSEEDRVKYYGRFGYGSDRLKLFTFLCHHRPQYGHCVLVDMQTQEVITMAHTDEFYLVTDDEC